MTDDDRAIYADALAESLRHCRGAQERRFLEGVLRTMGLTGEEADEVITYGLAHDILTEEEGGIQPAARR